MSLGRLAVFLVTAATLAATWLVLPPPVGLGLRLVAVQGSSMVPTLQPGDLVVVMPSESYLPGQVVAYRSDMLGGVVLLHRIQGYDAGGRLITRGDANGFDDSDRPRPQQVMGVMKMRLPLVGKYLQAVPQPPVAASIAGGAIAAAVAMGSGRKRRQLVMRPGPVLGGLAAGALALAAGVALVVAQQVLPPTAEVNRPVAYQHQGQWEYSAPSLAPIYDSGAQARTGDPLFWRLSRPLQVSFTYRPPPELEGANGTLLLYARLGDYLPTGWRRTLPVAGPVAVQGGEATVEGVLDLALVQQTWREVMAAIGQENPTPVRLELVAAVTLNGSVLGEPFRDEATFSLPFRLDQIGAALEPPQSGSPAQLLSPVVDKTAVVRTVEERRLELGPIDPTLEQARNVGLYAIWGGGALLVLTAVLCLLAVRSPAGLASLMGAQVVRVARLPEDVREAAVVTGVGDIVQAAKITGSPVLADPEGALMVVSSSGSYLLPVPAGNGRRLPWNGRRGRGP
ncbi:MAG: S24/S26 family peptidase [Dehalococcoidia bacterium]|jgi:signal peptidase I|nr:S24/S26 family peptidase [Dehalococcoidia bacterium]